MSDSDIEGERGTVRAIRDIHTERRRQRRTHNYDHAHDDGHTGGELVGAAIAWAAQPHWLFVLEQAFPHHRPTLKRVWPDTWALPQFVAHTPREHLVKAAALLLAEIERLDRAEGRR